MKRRFDGTGKMWNNLIKPELKIASPMILVSVVANSENPQAGEITNNFLKSA